MVKLITKLFDCVTMLACVASAMYEMFVKDNAVEALAFVILARLILVNWDTEEIKEKVGGQKWSGLH